MEDTHGTRVAVLGTPTKLESGRCALAEAGHSVACAIYSFKEMGIVLPIGTLFWLADPG